VGGTADLYTSSSLSKDRGDFLCQDGGIAMIKILGQINDNKLPEVETERLYLRQRLVSDAEDIFAYASLPEVTWPAGFPPAESVAEEENYLENIMPKRWLEQNIPAGYGICLKGSNKVIGSVDFNHRHADDVFEMGYLLHPDYWGQGIMSEAAHALLEVGFNLVGLHKIEIECYSYNKASQRVAEKLGFTLESKIRDRKDAQGKRCDLLRYGLLKSEWEKL
jgi:RimJ/RimL family protein N-acetyltransferase